LEPNEIDHRYNEIKSDFEILGSWSLRYQSLVEMGRDLEPMDPRFKTLEFYVEGCVSALWIRGDLKDGKLYFSADSDGILPKGLTALLVHLFTGTSPQEILNWEGNPVKDLGFYQNMTPTRVEAFAKMIKKFKEWAGKSLEGQTSGTDLGGRK